MLLLLWTLIMTPFASANRVPSAPRDELSITWRCQGLFGSSAVPARGSVSKTMIKFQPITALVAHRFAQVRFIIRLLRSICDAFAMSPVDGFQLPHDFWVFVG